MEKKKSIFVTKYSCGRDKKIHFFGGAGVSALSFLCVMFSQQTVSTAVVLSFLITLCVAIFWEIVRHEKYGYPIDLYDIVFTCAGSVFASVLFIIAICNLP